MKRALAKDGFLQVKNTFKRFVSILLMALLGVGFFAGLKATSPDMQKTVDVYFDKHHVFDVEVLSTLGLSEKDIEALNNVEGCEVLPTYSTDAEFIVGETSIITKVYAYQDTQINGFELLEGRLPTGEKECVVEEAFLQMSELAIGDTITANGLEEDSVLKDDTFTIVGTISSPLYMSKERGTSKLGSGMIDCYMYVNENSFDAEVYTEAYLVFADAMQENTFGNGYEEKIDEVITTLEKVAEIREEERYQEIKDEATEVLTEKQKELEDAKAEAESQITEAENEIAEGESKIISAENEIQKEERNANAEFSKAETEIAEAENTLAEKQAEFENSKTTIEAQINQAEAGLEQLNTSLKQTQAAIEQLEAEYEGVTDPEQLQEKEIKLETLVQTKQTIEAQKAEVQAQIKEANQGLEQAEAQIQSARAQIEQNKKKLEDAKQAAKKEIAAARNEVATNKKKIEEAKVTLAEEKAKAEAEIADAEAKLADAQAEIDAIEKPEWYILDRTSNIGYNGYSQDSERIDNIAKVFPIVFFVVATLISLNSMTRMVEEQRVQIGTLKALGYHNGQIAAKYILYATLATVIGGVIGMLIGFNLIPNIVFSMYEMMYDLKEIQIEFNVYYAAIGLGIALVCIVGATIISCRKELKQMPAELMRPKAPKPGKRVFLEKIPLIWNHLNFTKKVTARNIFRYKKRFLMTIIGICGCTALVLAGFGLKNSISSMIPLQYGEIYRYTMQVSIKDGADASKLLQEIEQIPEVEAQISVNMQAGKTQKDGKQEDIQLIVPEDAAKLTEFITIRNRKEPLAIE